MAEPLGQSNASVTRVVLPIWLLEEPRIASNRCGVFGIQPSLTSTVSRSASRPGRLSAGVAPVSIPVVPMIAPTTTPAISKSVSGPTVVVGLSGFVLGSITAEC